MWLYSIQGGDNSPIQLPMAADAVFWGYVGTNTTVDRKQQIAPAGGISTDHTGKSLPNSQRRGGSSQPDERSDAETVPLQLKFPINSQTGYSTLISTQVTSSLIGFSPANS